MDVVVVGGGVAGCSAAFRLRELGHDVQLLEANDHLGGRIRTIRRHGFVVDTGGDTIISFYRRTLAAVDAMGRSSELVEVSGRSGMSLDGALHLLRPTAPLSYVTSRLLTLPQLARLTLGVARTFAQPRFDLFGLESLSERDGDVSVAAWARDTLGNAAYQRVIRPSIEARWYHGADEAIAPLAIGLVHRALTARFFTIRGGMDRLTKWLASDADVVLGAPVTGVRAVEPGVSVELADGGRLRADAAVIATPAPVAALLLEGPTAEVLADIDYSANTRVALGYEADHWSDFPVGTVYPVDTDPGPVAGVGLSGRGSDSAPPGGRLVEVHFRGSRVVSDAQAVERARRAVDELLGPVAAEPVLAEVVRWEAALPIPRPHRFRRLREAVALLPARIKLAGDYMAIGTIETALRSGEEAATALAASAGHEGRAARIGARSSDG